MRFAWVVRACLAGAVVVAAGCDLILGIDDGVPREAGGPDATDDVTLDGAPEANGAVDASDGGIAMCDTDAAFGTPTLFTTLAGPGNDEHLRLVPPSELVGVFTSVRDSGLGAADIYTASRASIGDTWKNITAVPGVNSASADNDPTVSADTLTIYFARTGSIFRATRANAQSAFDAPVLVTELNSGSNEFGPYLVDDGKTLYFSSTRASDAGVSQIYDSNPLADGGFTAVGAVNGQGTAGDNRFAAVTADQLVMYFASTRSGGQGGHDIWVATRGSTSLPFGAAHVVPEVSGPDEENADWVSSDRCRLYFTSNRSGTYKLYVATKAP